MSEPTDLNQDSFPKRSKKRVKKGSEAPLFLNIISNEPFLKENLTWKPYF